ncbi:N-acetylmuramoyl-L-alanine amidase [Croceicoccus estronivorus]|uniref:N-acetylmuramoyl-L-alanine amidase family protein n=1 Tax=Croceicoccus estronivorus TaxID=1172626 RepID=UPI00082A970B|nr:N-acetylmuramoyl-L-alanine amidase [Croceicoccus estronivorus]OCC23165.1 N-acetylmuramoyl-L-alanine amidase [Croceicoccus estronivorus]
MSPRVQLWLAVFVTVASIAGLGAFIVETILTHPGHGYAVRLQLPAAGRKIGLPKIEGPQDASRPLVVIDAGHGGHDPGASGAGYEEKVLTLGLAQALRDRLLAGGGIRVAMTRDTDQFLALAERRKIARILGAGLFISIHADSAGEKSGITGATIYTLSAKASDETAARLAARENRADRVNGVALEGQSDAVSAILVDLSQRRVREESAELAQLIIREGVGQMDFHTTPRRSAAFAVLKSADVPSVLFEAGYITNPEDARRLASNSGRERFAEVVDRAVRAYFARQTGV